MSVRCFSAAGWRQLSPPAALLESDTSFNHKGVTIKVHRRQDGHCEWIALNSWSALWHRVDETMRNPRTKADFRFSLRRACHKLGVRY